MKKIYFITSNKGKTHEAKIEFSKINVEIVQKNMGYPEIQADTLKEVASFGVESLKNKIDEPFILEDAGLFINVLNGFPGVYSAYVFQTIGCKGILNLLKDQTNRDAVFHSVFAYYIPDEKPNFFVGGCPGVISFEEKGSNGFGYDPIFIPRNESKTFAEMKINMKNSYSHRGKSLQKLVNFVKK